MSDENASAEENSRELCGPDHSEQGCLELGESVEYIKSGCKI